MKERRSLPLLFWGTATRRLPICLHFVQSNPSSAMLIFKKLSGIVGRAGGIEAGLNVPHLTLGTIQWFAWGNGPIQIQPNRFQNMLSMENWRSTDRHPSSFRKTCICVFCRRWGMFLLECETVEAWRKRRSDELGVDRTRLRPSLQYLSLGQHSALCLSRQNH